MKYLSSDPFAIPRPSKVMAGTCEACVYGRGRHVEGCAVVARWIRRQVDESCVGGMSDEEVEKALRTPWGKAKPQPIAFYEAK